MAECSFVTRMVLATLVLAALFIIFRTNILPYVLLHVSVWLRSAGIAGTVLVCMTFSVWIILGIPSTPFELVTASIYGFRVGCIVVAIGKTLGCMSAFHIGRCLGLRYISRWLQGAHGESVSAASLVRALDTAVRVKGWRIALPLQLAYMPIVIKNYGLSLCNGVSSWLFFWTFMVGEMPATVATVYAGSMMPDVLQVLRSSRSTADSVQHGTASRLQFWILATGFGALAVTMFVVTSSVREVLYAHTHGEAEGSHADLDIEFTTAASTAVTSPNFVNEEIGVQSKHDIAAGEIRPLVLESTHA